MTSDNTLMESPKFYASWTPLAYVVSLMCVCASEAALRYHDQNKKLSYRRVTARCVLSVVILPIATQQCRNYLPTTSPDQTDGMKLEV